MSGQTKQEVGAIVREDGVSFRVWAPFASGVAVTGTFNDWGSTAMESEGDGYWHVLIEHAQAGQEYRYVITNGQQTLSRNDPRALQLSASGENSVIVGMDFDWQGDDFQLMPANQQIIYELYIGTFNRPDPATPGTFLSAIERLDYLRSLGVTTIELMPVSEDLNEHWWGYTPDYPFTVKAAYGGRYGLMSFVREAHARSMGVLLDVVYNHANSDESGLWRFDGWHEDNDGVQGGGIYFYNDWRSRTPFGERLDYGRPEVRDYIADNVRLWLQDCHIDGLRVDSTIYLRNVMGRNDDPATDLPDGWRVLQEITETAGEINPRALVIAEDAAANDWINKPVSEGGAGFAAQWDVNFPYVLRDALDATEDQWRNLDSIRGSLERYFNGQAFAKVIYSESHDIDANGRQRLNEEIAPGHADSLFARRRSNLAAALVLTAPGIPMLFQGQEFMENGSFTHWRELDWERVETYHGIVQLYRDLIRLRRNQAGKTAGLTGGWFETIYLDEKEKLFAYRRWDKGGPGDDVVVLFNFANTAREAVQLKFPAPGNWQVRFNSDWKGYSEDFTEVPADLVWVEHDVAGVAVGPYSVIILSQD